jgi:hypothetical protein
VPRSNAWYSETGYATKLDLAIRNVPEADFWPGIIFRLARHSATISNLTRLNTCPAGRLYVGLKVPRLGIYEILGSLLARTGGEVARTVPVLGI